MGNEKDARCLEAIQTQGWLDNQVRIHNERKNTYELNGYARLYMPEDAIYMGDGIGYVAGLLGLGLKEALTNHSEFPYRYSFEYKGTEFVQLSEKKIPCRAPQGCGGMEDDGKC